MEFDEDACTSI
jgi:hypothetical protein